MPEEGWLRWGVFRKAGSALVSVAATDPAAKCGVWFLFRPVLCGAGKCPTSKHRTGKPRNSSIPLQTRGPQYSIQSFAHLKDLFARAPFLVVPESVFL
jgi:hypothetical protein